MPEIEVRIAEPNYQFASDSINVFIVMKIDETTRKVMRMDSEGYVTWDDMEYPAGEVKPTLTLQNDMGPLLLEALLRRYQGASDLHTVRADLLHERARVDKCLEILMGNSKQLAEVAEKLAEC